jgi:hypothetical protein
MSSSRAAGAFGPTTRPLGREGGSMSDASGANNVEPAPKARSGLLPAPRGGEEVR